MTRVDGVESEAFSVETGPIQGAGLSLLMLNLAVENRGGIRKLIYEVKGIKVDRYHAKVPGFLRERLQRSRDVLFGRYDEINGRS